MSDHAQQADQPEGLCFALPALRFEPRFRCYLPEGGVAIGCAVEKPAGGTGERLAWKRERQAGRDIHARGDLVT